MNAWWRTVLVMSCLGAFALGCDKKSSSDAPQGGAAGRTVETGAPAQKPGSAGPIGGCTSFADQTGENGDRTIPWDTSFAKSPLRCIKVKAGQDVTWEGDFAKNPMVPVEGDTPSPIAEVPANISNPGMRGEERSMAHFKKPGTFGYASSKDPAMKGGIQVVP